VSLLILRSAAWPIIDKEPSLHLAVFQASLQANMIYSWLAFNVFLSDWEGEVLLREARKVTLGSIWCEPNGEFVEVVPRYNGWGGRAG